MAFATPKDSIQIQDRLILWLNANLPDPYEQRTQKNRADFVIGGDFNHQGVFPKIHVDMGDYVPNKVATQGKTDFLQEEEHHFMIYYYNFKAHRYKFDDNGLTLQDAAQCRKYLEFIQDKLKANATDFNDFFHKPSPGTIPKPVFTNSTKLWWSVLPFTVFTYRR